MISPNLAAAYGLQLASIYQDAELRILARLAAALARGIETPQWEIEALARIQEVRVFAVAELSRTNAAASAQITAALLDAYGEGELSAFADLREALEPQQVESYARRAAVQALAQEVATTVASGTPGILRGIGDVFREVVADAVASRAAGGEFRTEAAQRALTRLTERGLSSIQTARGTMNLPDYVNMAVRTGAANAAFQGHVESMAANGINLVVVHPGPRACKVCDRWAREILVTNGSPGRVVTPAYGRIPESVTVVKYTLAQARAAGWGHPNCRCGMHSYLPGVTDRSIIERPTWDRKGYEAQQRQRVLEREIRSAKTREATALTPAMREKATRLKLARQKEIRDHLAAHPSLKRQSKREQIGNRG